MYFSHMFFYFLVASSPSLQMLHDVSLLNMDHVHRADTPAFSFSQQTGGAGWHMFLPLAIALHTLDRQSGSDNEKRVLLPVSKPICCESSFQILYAKWFQSWESTFLTLSHISTPKMSQKKNKMSTWKWHPNARCPTHRVKVGRYAAMQLTHLSRDVQRYVISLKSKIITNIHEQHP